VVASVLVAIFAKPIRETEQPELAVTATGA